MSKIKLSDYIAKRLKEKYNVKHFFMVSGGGAMHLNDSLGHAIPYTANHHEQGCAIAAEGYARVSQELAVVNVTTGPGGLNCLNGVFGQWTDSVPVLYISGQVKYSTMMDSCKDIPLRQLGDQEVDIISVVKPLTKYAVTVLEPNEIKYHLDKAIYEATTGRFGPVWLNIPMNVQGAMVDENELVEFKTEAYPIEKKDLQISIKQVIEKLKISKRPLIIAGHGIRLSKQIDNFYKLIEKLNIPVVTTFNGMDLIENDNPLFIGRIGTIGQRAGNFALQNADLLLELGTRNNIRQVSYNWENFGKNAYKIIVDIDKAELEKPLIKPDLAINADLKDFMPALLNELGITPHPSPYLSKNDTQSFLSAESQGEREQNDCHSELVSKSIDKKWLDFCQNLKEKYSFENEKNYIQKENELINPYYFARKVTENLDEGDIFVMGNGSGCVCPFQVGKVKKNQRFILNSGDASMGYDLPAALGACIAGDGRRTICFTGDGSIMMNIQELETISYNKLPVKIFILNNSGYSSIRQTQRNFFDGRMTGSGSDSGVGMPCFTKLAESFGIKSVKIEHLENIDEQIQSILKYNGAIVCEVMIQKEYMFIPKLSSKKLEDGTMVSPSLEDMYPFLDRKDFENNILT